ncbi:MAG: flagellar assembly protein H, partial [Microcystis sp. M155S2]|nr:flagellar assembly protein H [Microcystis sp. M155S2]
MLSQVSRSLETIPEKQVQSNLAAATSILAGLVLNRETIKNILRSDIMRESVIYQDILEEGREEGEEKGLKKGLQAGKEEKARQIALKMLSAGFPIPEIAQ